jgi:hypothetical protein
MALLALSKPFILPLSRVIKGREHVPSPRTIGSVCSFSVWGFRDPHESRARRPLSRFPADADADPSVRYKVVLCLPGKLRVTRTDTTLSSEFDMASLQEVPVTVGKNMVMGIKDELRVYAVGGPRPDRAPNIGLSSSVDFCTAEQRARSGSSTDVLNRNQGGVPETGRKYIVELDPNIQILNHITENIPNVAALRAVIANVFNAPGDPAQLCTSAPKQHAVTPSLSLPGQQRAEYQEQKSPLPGTSARPKKEVGHRNKKEVGHQNKKEVGHQNKKAADQSVESRPSLPNVRAVFRPSAATSRKRASGGAPSRPEASGSPLNHNKPSELADTILPSRASRIGGPTVSDIDAAPLVSPVLAAHYDREKLYDAVWRSPMREIAKLYGISDVGLAKTCRKLFIPLPGRGYWAKKAASQPVPPRPLLPLVRNA